MLLDVVLLFEAIEPSNAVFRARQSIELQQLNPDYFSISIPSIRGFLLLSQLFDASSRSLLHGQARAQVLPSSAQLTPCLQKQS